MSVSVESQTAPPYVPFLAFDNFIEKLKKTTVPSHIDKSMMTTTSGAIQGQLMAALRFLGLILTNGQVQQELQSLVDSRGTAEWKPTLATIVHTAYKPIIGSLNHKTGTYKQLKDSFAAIQSIDSSTIDKAIRFYIKALKSAGEEVSPYFTERKPYTKRTSSEKDQSSGRTVKQKPFHEDEPATDSVPIGMIRYPLHIPGNPKIGHIVFPEDLNEADCAMIDSILRAYATRRAEQSKGGERGTKPEKKTV